MKMKYGLIKKMTDLGCHNKFASELNRVEKMDDVNYRRDFLKRGFVQYQELSIN